MNTLSARYITLLVTGTFLMLTPLLGYERFCEPEITHIYVSELTDRAGNIYLQGLIFGEADMDPGEGSQILSNHRGRSYILKLDREGNFLWVRQLDADISEMALDQAGNVLITGNFWGEVDFDPGEGSHFLSTERDGMFLLSLDPSGSFINVLIIENANSNHITLDSSGNIYISGEFNGVADFDPGANSRTLFSENGNNYILMLQKDGALGWVRQLETYIFAIAPDESGNLHFNGSYSGNVIGKLDGSGTLLWNKKMPDTRAEGSISISKSGTITLTGEFLGRFDFDPGPDTFYLESEEGRNSVYVVNLDADGNFLWAGNTWGGYGSRATTDDSGNLILTGFFTDSLLIKIGPVGEILVADEENPNIFLLHLDQEGNLLLTRRKILQYPGFNNGSQLSVHTSGREGMILSGIMQEEYDFDCANTMAFISWLDEDGTTVNDLILDLEGAGDPFEDNDQIDMASYLDDSLIYNDLTISEEDDDWYDLSASTQSCINPHAVTISCFFDHSEGDINMELVNAKGSAVVASMSETDNEQITYQAGPDETIFLRVYLSSGSGSSYSLRWEDACYLEFPDPKFLYALIEEGVDSDGDSLISSAEAGLVHYLDLAGKGISDLTGIGAFMYLDSLDCSSNHLSSLDLSNCQQLKSLICDHNQLSYLKVSDNKNLAKLSCNNNQLPQLFITDNKELKYLDCSHNQLESLYLIYNGSLLHLDASGNMLERLNLDLNPLIGSQSHSGLILSNMPSLNVVCVSELPFPPADFLGTLDTTGSPGLSFTSDCRLDSFVYIPDPMFRKALIEEEVDENMDKLISLEEAKQVSYLNISNAEISDLTGIEDFINLERLYCENNNLVRLDLSNNKELRFLYCDNNPLDSLNVSHLTNLARLNCKGNLLDTLDVSGNRELVYLFCSRNQLSSLDVSSNILLRYLECDDNLLDALDLSGKLELRRLDCSHNLITKLELNDAPRLETVNCENNQIDTLEIAYSNDLTELSCNDNLLNSLVLLECHSLKTLNCQFNQLSSLDLNGCLKLRTVQCEQNKLSSLDISGLTDLSEFYCSGNQLMNLDISENVQLSILDCGSNLLTSFDLSANIPLEWISLDSMPDLRQVCVWQLPFPPDQVEVDTSGSPNVLFENRCGSYRDHLEENDRPEEAAYLEKGLFHQDLIVTADDEDWYLLVNENHTSYSRIRVECQFDSSGGDMVLDLLTLDGTLLASSESESDTVVLDYISENHAQYLLSVSLDSGSQNSYSLYWNLLPYQPHSDLSVCLNGSDCSQVRIDPASGTGTHTLDTLKLELLSGDKRIETIEITNQGPGPYFFYSALDCTSFPDNLNKAIRFNGTDAYIRIPRNHALDAPQSMTIEAWIRNKAGKTGSNAIVSKGFKRAGYELYVAGNDQGRRIGFRVAQADIQSEAVLEDNRWYHVAATYANQSLRLYINGILDKVEQTQGSILAVNQDLFIGARDARFDSESFYLGDVDEVRIWNRVRADDEIHAYMHRELKEEEAGLIGYWPFSRGENRVVIDQASGNHGLMIGGAERISSSNPVVGLIDWFPETGLVSVNSSVVYQLEFDAASLKAGNYITAIEFISNNPCFPGMHLPTSLQVTEAPSFSIQPEFLDLGEIDIYKTHTHNLIAINKGTQTLEIDSVRTDLVGSRITPASARLDPGESKTFKVEVFPRNFESFSGCLTFYTNDPSDQEVELPISGEGTNASEVAILQEIDATLQQESKYLRIMGFENTKTLHGLTLYSSLKTYHLPEIGSDLMLEADSLPKSWIRTTLPDIGVLPPLGVLKFNLILESYSLPVGDYYADVVFEWYNPSYQKGYITVRMHVQNTVGIEQASLDSGPLLIYPNPTRGELFLSTSENEAEYHISISSINGLVTIQKSFTGSLYRIDLSGYPKGIYIVSVRSKNKIMNQKIILH